MMGVLAIFVTSYGECHYVDLLRKLSGKTSQKPNDMKSRNLCHGEKNESF